MRLIDADALLEYKFPNGFSRWDEQEVVYAVYEKDILSAPTIETEPTRHGHWINGGFIMIGSQIVTEKICSVCGAGMIEASDFCGACGAKMDEGA